MVGPLPGKTDAEDPLFPQKHNLYFSTKQHVSRWVQGPAPAKTSPPPPKKEAENLCRHQTPHLPHCFSHWPCRTCEREEGGGMGQEATKHGAHWSAR